MKERVYIIGAGMTPMRKQAGPYETLCETAISEAMEDAGLSFAGDKDAIGGIWYGNCAQGMLTSQHSIRGQVILRRLGFECMPVVNVENACATASTALNQAVIHILAGISDLALAVGVEKMSLDLERLSEFPEIAAALPHMGLSSFWNGCEQDRKSLYIEKWRREKSETLGIPLAQTDVGKDRSPFMDNYAVKALQHMKKYGYTQEQIAKVCAKTHHHSTMNPKAQYRKPFTWEEVMADKPITYPLTRPMCAPRGEGCAAAVVCSQAYLDRHKNETEPVEVLASVLVSGRSRGDFDQDISGRAAQKAFEESRLKPNDIDVLELHDATSFAEIFQTGQAGFLFHGPGGGLLFFGRHGPWGRTAHQRQRRADITGPPGGLHRARPDLRTDDPVAEPCRKAAGQRRPDRHAAKRRRAGRRGIGGPGLPYSPQSRLGPMLKRLYQRPEKHSGL